MRRCRSRTALSGISMRNGWISVRLSMSSKLAPIAERIVPRCLLACLAIMKTSSRLLRLLALLPTRRSWSGEELADKLSVTTRTVRNDVERLRDAGYAIDSTSGVAGGYRLAAGAELPPLLLDHDEATVVALALRRLTAGGVRGHRGDLATNADEDRAGDASARPPPRQERQRGRADGAARRRCCTRRCRRAEHAGRRLPRSHRAALRLHEP